MRFATLVCLLGTLFLACANDPADVRFGDGTITIYGYTLPLENFRIHGYENIPTPTLDPAQLPAATAIPTPELTQMPSATETPTPTPLPPTPRDAVATLSAADWLDDTVISQYYGQVVSVPGVLGGFRHSRGLVWNFDGGSAGVFCNFPDGWAGENEELLWDWVDNQVPIVATGRIMSSDSPPIGKRAPDHARDEGLLDCSLASLTVQ